MSTPSKQQPVTPRPTAPAPTPRPAVKPTMPAGNQTFLFDKDNYMWMIGGLVLILLGMMLLSGGKSDNPNEFNYAEIYSFRRITLAPIILMVGFAVEAYAIMKKPKEKGTTSENQ